MEYRNLQGIDKPVSRMVFGTAIPPFLKNEDHDDLLDAVVELGINTFDLARVYQGAEPAIGRWISRRGNRSDLILLSKCGHPTPLGRKRVSAKEMKKDLATSLQYLNTDYLDIYLLHRDDPAVDVAVPVETFNEMYAEKKIRAFGGSNWTHERIQEANEYAYKHNLVPFTVSSPHYSLAEQVKDPWGGGCVTITGEANQAARAFYRESQIPVFAYASLCHGFFSGKLRSEDSANAKKILDPFAVKGYVCPENYERLRRAEQMAEKYSCSVSQIALAWLFAQPENVFAAVGSSSIERMKQNAAALQITLTPEEREYLNLQRD